MTIPAPQFDGFFAPSRTTAAKEITLTDNTGIPNSWLPQANQGYTAKSDKVTQGTDEYITQQAVAGTWDARLAAVMKMLKLHPDPSGMSILLNTNPAIAEQKFDETAGWHISDWKVIIVDKTGQAKASITPGQGDLICDVLTWQQTADPLQKVITKHAWPHYP
jgi:hypothetical protein